LGWQFNCHSNGITPTIRPDRRSILRVPQIFSRHAVFLRFPGGMAAERFSRYFDGEDAIAMREGIHRAGGAFHPVEIRWR
jgi:hypothetical protein